MSRPTRRVALATASLVVIAPFAPSPAHADTALDVRMTVAPQAVRDSSGATWSPTGSFVGGSLSSVHNNPVAGTPDQDLFRYERYGMKSWSYDLPSGCYDVTLKAREKYFSSPGKRIFTVLAEGRPLVSDLDIYKAVGKDRAVESTFRVPVKDGRLNVDFAARVDHPLISAIRVRHAGTDSSCGVPTPVSSTPTPTPAPDAAAGVGAGPVGSARYPVPAGAVFVAPQGSDGNRGTAEAPLRTVTAALTKVAAGGTIVLRGGTYHESVLIPPSTPVTVQPYPGEAVWFDGARPVQGFARDGAAWSAPWNLVLDASPTYTRGAPDNTQENWRFVSPTHPMAAHPDQVWIDGVAQRQVGTAAQVTAGTFYVDATAKKLVLGTDPTGRRVEAGALSSAFSLRAPGTVLRGFGIRRYVPSVPDFGAVTSFFPRMTLDNMTVVDSSTAGVGLYAGDCVVRATTIKGSGMIGLQGNEADRLLVERTRIEGNNTEHFNQAPVAGGMKFARSRGLTLKDSHVAANDGIGVWMDESVYDMKILRNTIVDNANSGVMLELSSKAVVAGNRILRSGVDALAIRNTNNVRVWNNTLQADYRAIEVSQDNRRPWNSPGQLDTRFSPDPEMTFVISDVTMKNNVLVGGPKGLMTLGVEDFDQTLDATRQRIVADGNVYAPASRTAPRWLAAWSRVGTDPYVHTDLATFAQVNGQERTGVSKAGTNVLTADGSPTPDVVALAPTVAHALPSDIALLLGRPSGSRALGAW